MGTRLSTTSMAVLRSGSMVFSGAASAVFPATLQAVASRIYSQGDQASLAISIGLGALLAGFIGAVTLEARLADQSLHQQTYVPLWAFVAGVVASVSVVVMPGAAPVMVVATPLIMVALQLGRMHAVVAGSWRSEIAAGSVMLAGCVTAFVLISVGPRIAMIPCGVAAAFSICLRQLGARRHDAMNPSFARRAWVGAETLAVAGVPFASNILVWISFGPQAAVGFRLVLTVLGVLQPLLGYLRTVLLRSEARRLTGAVFGASMVALIGVIASEVMGVPGLIFGSAWHESVGLATVVAACLWKMLSLPANIPFASMRRSGIVRTVFVVRLTSSVAYLVFGIGGGIALSGLVGVFLGFGIAEVLTWFLYNRAAQNRGMT